MNDLYDGIFPLTFQDYMMDLAKKMFSVTIGMVKENWHKDFPGMVKVQYFVGEEGKNVTDWIRVASPYAGNGYGVYLHPEVGDEVIVAYNMGEIGKPYVIASLWNAKDKLPEKTALEKNNIKRIKTKGGHEIIFDDEEGKGSIEIHTPKKLTISLQDEKQIIAIKDEKGDNMLEIDSQNGKITVKAKSAIELKAGGTSLKLENSSATLKSDSVTIEGNQALKLKGQNASLQGNTMTEVKSSAQLKVEAGAIAQIKGAMVKIN